MPTESSFPSIQHYASTTPHKWPSVGAPAAVNQVSFIVYENTPDAANNEVLRKEVRSKAARSSAALRKATMAKKFGQRAQARKAAAAAAATTDPVDDASVVPVPPPALPRRKSAVKGVVKPIKTEALDLPAREASPEEVTHDNFKGDFSNPDYILYCLRQGAPIARSPQNYLPSERISPINASPQVSDIEGFATSYGHEKMITPLWREVMQFGPLYHAVLLVTGSHSLPMKAHPAILFYKQCAIESMRDAVMSARENGTNTNDQLVPAIALLAGWEHVSPSLHDLGQIVELILPLQKFGDVRAYNTHMQVLVDISSRGTALDVDGRNRLATALEDLVVNAGPNLATNASKQSAFGDGIPLPGFVELQEQGLVDPTLVQLMARLSSADTSKPDIGLRLRELFLQLSAWLQPDPPAGLPPQYQGQWIHGHWQMRSAALVLTGGLFNVARNIDFYISVADGMNMHHTLPPIIRSSVLAGTPYAAVSAWALTIQLTGPGTWTLENADALKILLFSLGITTYEAYEELLARFNYPRLLLGQKCQELWQDIVRERTVVWERPVKSQPRSSPPAPAPPPAQQPHHMDDAGPGPDEKSVHAPFGLIVSYTSDQDD
nr:hypothetical protein CFP56_01151 [Quercus suber]